MLHWPTDLVPGRLVEICIEAKFDTKLRAGRTYIYPTGTKDNPFVTHLVILNHKTPIPLEVERLKIIVTKQLGLSEERFEWLYRKSPPLHVRPDIICIPMKDL